MTILHLISSPDEPKNSPPYPYSFYAEQDWKLLPCFGFNEGRCRCKSPHNGTHDAGKHPIILDWTKEATSDLNKLATWFGEEYSNNVAIYCKGSGLVVIDIDPRNGGDESFLELESFLDGAIPSTVTALTGEYIVRGKKIRGRHLYFKADKDLQFFKDFSKLGLKGIDIKWNGYVLLPPSKHASGVDYVWEDGLNPADTGIAELTPEMRSVMVKSKKTPTGNANMTDYLIDPSQKFEATSYAKRELSKQVSRIKNETQKGERNVTLNHSAFVMGQLIGGGQIAASEVIEELSGAASYAFRGENAEDEILSVLRIEGGGLEAGAQLPVYDVTFQQKSAEEEVGNIEESEFLRMLNIVDLDDLWADTSEETWLVDGIICSERGHTFYSDPGVGKSLLIREICACLASGRGVLGLPPKEPVKILYIDHENIPKTDIRRSLKDMGFKPEDLRENFILMSFPEFAPFDLPKGGQQLKRVLEILQPQLVVMDTASRTIQGKENDNDTWIDFYNYTGKILKALGIAYIRIDHTGKNASAGPRGGSAKMGDVDLVWYLKEEETDRKYKLENEKHRVPLTHLEFKISRELGPLRHVLSNGIDWIALTKGYARFEEIQNCITEFMTNNPKQNTGLNSLYSAMRGIIQERGYSRREFDEARKTALGMQGDAEY